MKVKKIIFSITCLISIYFISCATVPITGRRQILIMPESEIVAMSQTNYNELLSKAKLSGDKQKVAMVRNVGKNIAQATENFLKEKGLGSELKYYKWEFNLIEDDKTINAFCMPGGKIAVYTGIMKLADTEAQLAVVIAHEVAHAIAKHGNERMSQIFGVQLGGAALQQALSKKTEKTQQVYMTAFGLGAKFGFVLPYSRKHEEESDHIGLILMAKAGYNPEEAVYFWQKMRDLGGAGIPEFMSTHPASDTRIDNIKNLLPEARQQLKR